MYVFQKLFSSFLTEVAYPGHPVLEGVPETGSHGQGGPGFRVLNLSTGFCSQSEQNEFCFVSCVGEDVLAVIFVYVSIIQTNATLPLFPPQERSGRSPGPVLLQLSGLGS